METLDSIGIKLCWAALKEYQLYLSLFFCLCCIVPLSVHYRLCLVTVCVKVLQIGRLLRFSKRTDCWCTFSWSICKQNGQSSSFQGNDDIHIMGGHHQLRVVVENQNLSERDRGTLKRTVSINHRSTATKVTAELIFIFETLFPQKQPSQIQHPWWSCNG